LLARLALVPRDLAAVTKLCDDRAKRALEVHERARAAARAPFPTHRARRVEAHAALVLHFWETLFFEKVSFSRPRSARAGLSQKKRRKTKRTRTPKKNWLSKNGSPKTPKLRKLKNSENSKTSNRAKKT
jgi:hypothetical protein